MTEETVREAVAAEEVKEVPEEAKDAVAVVVVEEVAADAEYEGIHTVKEVGVIKIKGKKERLCIYLVWYLSHTRPRKSFKEDTW